MTREADFPWPGYDPDAVPKLWETIDQYLERQGVRIGAPAPNQTTDGTHAVTSLHYTGRARDYGRSNCDSDTVARTLQPLAGGKNPRLVELFYAPLNIFWKRGVRITPSQALFNLHLDHCHASLADGATLDDLP